MTTKLAAKFMHSQRDKRANTISEIIEALRKTDADYEDKTLEEEFRDIKKQQGEAFPSYMARLRTAYHEIEKRQAEPNSHTRLRKIKQQFFRGGDIPDDIKDPLRTCEDLERIAEIVKEDMERRRRESPPYHEARYRVVPQPTYYPQDKIPRSHRRGDTYTLPQPNTQFPNQHEREQTLQRQETENEEEPRDENQHTRGAASQGTLPTRNQ